MTRFTILLIAAAALIGCTTNTRPGEPVFGKGEVDIDQLRAADWPVAVDGDLGTVEIPFVEPIPPVADDIEDPAAEIARVLELMIRSDETGTTVNITDGTYLDSDPTGLGEFTCSLNSGRDVATVTFWNESSDGLTLKTDRTYTVQITIQDNDYVETLPANAFTVQPE